MTSRGSVIAPVPIVDNGLDLDHFVLVIVAEGFTNKEQNAFAIAADVFVNALQLAAPFNDAAVWEKLNIYRLDAESDESGADNPASCPDDEQGYVPLPPETAETYLQATYCSSGVRRVITVTELVTLLDDLDLNVSAWDAAVVIVNHQEYGGSGDEANGVAVCSVHVDSTAIAIHELGHVFGLRDEYENDSTSADTYTGVEPPDPNITTDPAGAKWAGLLTATNLPTWSSPDCTVSNDGVLDPEPGAVGAYEGADHYHCGLYRPCHECRMRHQTFAFCPVCDAHLRDYLDNAFFFDWDRADPSTCFVATAVYGDVGHPDVTTLRDWRDRHLRPGARGRVPMRLLDTAYRLVGPRLAVPLLGRPGLARFVRRRALAPAAAWLRDHER